MNWLVFFGVRSLQPRFEPIAGRTSRLGIERLKLVAGWSMGGCQAYQWGAQYPDMMDAIAPLWKVSLLPSGATAVSSSTVNCGDLTPEYRVRPCCPDKM